MNRWAVLLVGFSLGLAAQTSPPPTNDPEIRREFWPEVDVYVQLREHSRLYVRYGGTRTASLQAYSDGQVGVYFDRWMINPIRLHGERQDVSLAKLLMVRAGYQYARPRDGLTTPTEHMVSAEGTGKLHLPWQLLVSDRNRFDFRWLNGNFQWRYRNRIKLERAFQAGKFQFIPYFHTEVFCSLDQRRWNRVRYSAGGETAVARRVGVDLFAALQNDWLQKTPDLHALGLALKFYLR